MQQVKFNISDIRPNMFNLSSIFQYLYDFSDDLPEQDLYDLIILNCTSPAFRNGELTKQGILQICLLATEPFNFESSLTEYKNRILDVRNGQKVSCKDRIELLKSLSSVLYNSWYNYRHLHKDIESKLKRLNFEFNRQKHILMSYFDLPSNGKNKVKDKCKKIYIERL